GDRGAVLLHLDVRRLRQPALSRGWRRGDPADPDHRHDQVRPAMATCRGDRLDHDRDAADCRLRGDRLRLSDARQMNGARLTAWLLRLYIVGTLLFIFAP